MAREEESRMTKSMETSRKLRFNNLQRNVKACMNTCFFMPLIISISMAAQLDSLLLPICESSNQIYVTKEKYKFQYSYLDSTYKFREIKKVLTESPSSSKHMKVRTALIWIGIPIFAAGATMQIADLASGNYNFLSPLNLAGNIVMYTGLGITVSSTRRVKLAIHSFNNAQCQ